jgi:anti-anti-sigma factor
MDMDDQRLLALTEDELGDGQLVIGLSGELDVMSASKLKAAFDHASADGHTRVVVDLSDVSLVDSTGLSVLVTAHKHLRRAGVDLCLVVPHRGLLAPKLEITGLDRLFSMFDSRDEAVARPI